MGPGERVACVLEDIFVEFSVLRLWDFGLIFQPEGFVFIKSFELVIPRLLGGSSVDCILNFFISEFLGLGFPLFFQGLMLVSQFLVRFLDFFFIKIFLSQVNRVVDKWTVLLNKFFELLVSAEFSWVFFEMQADQCTTLEFNWDVLFDCERFGSWTGPLVLEVVVVFWDDFDSGGDEEGWVKSNTELSNEVDITGIEVLNEVGGARFGYSTQVGNELVFSHSNTIINDFECFLIGIKLNLNLELSLTTQKFRFFNGEKPDFIKCVGGITDEFPQEDFFLSIEGVNDNIHQSRMSRNVPANFGLELVGLFLGQGWKAGHDDHKGHDERE